ncbi:MAG: AAA family ATPase [Atopobiaceae bacterium]|nr:AAA family ATPase [Atopobiaceae bacterium]
MTKRNPFTPAFGGPPRVFFGRARELALVRAAMENDASPHKALFITGNRGCGKTTLLEKISQEASRAHWMTLDVHSSHAVQTIIELLAGGTQKTTTREARPSAMGVSAGGISSSATSTYSNASLAILLADACRSLVRQRGILITIDEIQKVPENDAEDISAAVQLALRKGLPVMLVLAGLPGAKEQVAGYPGCTFMRRAYDMQIGSLEVDETLEAFRKTVGLVDGLDVGDDALWEMGLFSQGYPYLMQLIGYYLVERTLAISAGGTLRLGSDDVRSVEAVALEDYRANVLEPILGSLPPTLSCYLRAMGEAVGVSGRASTGDVARLLGKQPRQVSSYRQRLLEKRLIEKDGHGYARFLLPHIPDYYADPRESVPRDPRQQWNRQ